ncbi:MBL fold metallo-hydrolase [Anaeromicrobium sediminis]|uniref:MBL fold metallo-hydrolase n=1 Tax=Anaeromicrobium sediminis TaxID=1478221 RepID=A0A267MN39_9FIRM|nr:hypothetical protein [Anaeromicrobium sediminis]PAB61014.1 hypothetical protein CCE28_00870 [Anaeromicrobium sediminis]
MKIKLSILLSIFIILWLCIPSFALESTTQPLPQVKVYFIDVGQADSIYIQAPKNYNILIDAGNNDDGQLVVNYFKN